MHTRPYLLCLALLFAACSGGPAASKTQDARVHALTGQVPPEIPPDARWIGAPAGTLASLRGRVVYVQFAFPT